MSDNITTDEMALALFCLELADHNQDISVQTLPWIHKEFTLFKDLPAEYVFGFPPTHFSSPTILRTILIVLALGFAA